MYRIFFAAGIGLLSCLASRAQVIDKAADNAFLITRMVDKFHVGPRTVDWQFSEDLFNTLIKKTLDEERIYFTREDLATLDNWKGTLDKELLGKRKVFLKQLCSLYEQRIRETDSLLDVICSKPFDFSIHESLSVAEDTNFAPDATARRLKLYKELKKEALEDVLDYYEETAGKKSAGRSVDSLEKAARRKALHTFRRAIQHIEQSSGGITSFVCNAYCEAVASCFDPHTEYFTPEEKENFQGVLGDNPLQFGFSLNQGKEGVEIARLRPGSPAYKCGQMNVGDRLLTLQWESQEPVDVSDATTEEISRIISSDNASKLSITLQKTDGSTRKVILQKEKAVSEDDLGKVKSFVLKGSSTIGFIALPAFYADWENGKAETGGCSDDVAKEIIKMKREGLDALIIDIRYNGGGSVAEAIALAGIFIDYGPVGMVQDREGKLFTLKDMNRGTIYDGPLLIMVNGLSASASEMFAAALQDYHRALIVGSPTYGKATAQIVLPLDTVPSLSSKTLQGKGDAFIKITINKLFRLNGTTAQEVGVQPDIRIHDLSEAEPDREKTADFVIKASSVPPNKFYHPLPPLPLSDLRAFSSSFTDTNRYYHALSEYLASLDSLKTPRDFSLTLHMPAPEKSKSEGKGLSDSATDVHASPFEVYWSQYEKERMKTDDALRFDNELWREELKGDQEILLCYLIASRMAHR